MANTKPAWAGQTREFYVEVFRRRGFVEAIVYDHKGGEVLAEWEMPNALRGIPEAVAEQAAIQTEPKPPEEDS